LRFLREKLGKIQKPQRPLRKSQRKCSFADLALFASFACPFADLYSEGLAQEEEGYGQAGVENFGSRWLLVTRNKNINNGIGSFYFCFGS
jgi:hypothetical protein